MNLIQDLLNLQQSLSGPVLLLGIGAGVTIFVLFAAILLPSSGKPKSAAATVSGSVRNIQGIQAKLDNAQIEISAKEYIRRSLTYGIPVGVGLALLIGSAVLVFVGIVTGFMVTWTNLEQERDRKLVKYTKQLASACDTIRTAYGVNPSLKKALEAVAEYAQSPVKEDFREILVAASQERFVEGLQQVAERRRSIVFDTVSTSLIRASEASGEVNDMLVRLADSTRQNVAAFEDALTSQLNARSSITWGTYGPWLIFCIFRLMTLGLGLMVGGGGAGNIFGPLTSFFTTPGGNVLAAVAATVSILVYRNATKISQRGLVVRRVSMTEAAPTLRSGQRPMSGQLGAAGLSAQTRHVTANAGGDRG